MTSTIYKLTDRNMRTYSGFQWEIGVTKTASGDGNLCGPGWLHAYEHPMIAAFMDPVHADLGPNARLFRGIGIVGKRAEDWKVGCTEIKLTEEISLPVLTSEQRVATAIRCVQHVYKDPKWNHWADAWLNGSDRSVRATKETAERASAVTCTVATWNTAAAAAWDVADAALAMAMRDDSRVESMAARAVSGAGRIAAIDAARVASSAGRLATIDLVGLLARIVS